MNKSELIKTVASATGNPQVKVAEVVTAVFAQLTKSLATGDKVAIPGFGTFQIQTRKPRFVTINNGGNAGKRVMSTEKRYAKFKGAKALSDAVNQ